MTHGPLTQGRVPCNARVYGLTGHTPWKVVQERSNENQMGGLGDGGVVQVRMAIQTTGPQSSGPLSTHVCETCGKVFGSRRGLGQHRRLKHPSQHNDQVNVERSKGRWSPEEVRLMAQMEAKATIDGVKALNKHLHALKPERSLEGVKGKRRDKSYRMQVTSLIASLRTDQETTKNCEMGLPGVGEDRVSQRDELIEELKKLVAQMRRIRNKYARTLQELGEAALRGEHMDEAVFTRAIKSMFGAAACPKGPMHSKVVQYHGSRNQRRRQQYAHVQKLYKKDIKAAARVVLDDQGRKPILLPDEAEVFQSWSDVFQDGEGMPCSLEWEEEFEKESMAPLWRAISIEDVERARVASDSAAGPDGISPVAWNRINSKFKRLIYNLFVFYEKVPRAFKLSRTVFIPKVEGGSTDPADLRPLTICSVVLRGFNKILADRMIKLHDFDGRQNAYLPMDGVATCVFQLSGLLAHVRHGLVEFHVAGLDIAKAFPSLEHKEIIKSQMEAGCPRGFVNYLRNMYTDVTTLMQFEGHNRMTKVNRGVFQGDPTSGPVFTMALEGMLKSLNDNVGIDVIGARVNAGAYADDTNLFAGTRKGLQLNIDEYSRTGLVKGQCINAKKSWTLSLVPSGREKKMKVDTGKPFNVGGVPLKELTIDDLWRYLGVSFSSKGAEVATVNIEDDLRRLSRAPLKPQQRIHILKAYVISRQQQRLVLSRTTAKGLGKIDKQIRRYVLEWLKLPDDVPVAYLHAPVKSGGLGIPCLRLWVPLMRQNRLEKAISGGGAIMMALSECNLFKTIRHRCSQSLAKLGGCKASSLTYNSYWREQLLAKVDGSDLEYAWVHRSTTSWNSTMMSQVSGEDYVHYHQIRSNSLPTRVRTARGRPAKDTSCRGSCRRTETAHHVIQECHRTHGVRVQRHDRVVGILGEELERKYDLALQRQEFQVSGRMQKPDLILVDDDTAHVVDVQVVKGSGLGASHVRKVGKYQSAELERQVRERYGVGKVEYHACTLSYKGVWCLESVTDMKRLGVSEYCLFKIVTSTLRGTWLAWRCFNSVTHVRSGFG